MTFWRALKLGLLALAAVLVVVMIAGCSEVPEEVRQADACRTYLRNYEVMSRQAKGETMGVYLAERIDQCRAEGLL